MIERALLTPDEPKSLPKGNFRRYEDRILSDAGSLCSFFQMGYRIPKEAYAVPTRVTACCIRKEGHLEMEIVKQFAARRGDAMTGEKYPRCIAKGKPSRTEKAGTESKRYL